MTHSKDVVQKHYAQTTHDEVKGTRMALDSLIRAQSTQEPASTNRNAALVGDGAMPSTSIASTQSIDSLVSEATSDTSVRRSGREVDEAFISAFPLSARTVPALAAVRDWLKAINFEAKMSTAHSDKHRTSKRLIASWRRQAILKN